MRFKVIWNSRFLGVFLSISLLLCLSGCNPTREWDEEVRLPDGKTVTVHRWQQWNSQHPMGEAVSYGYENSSLELRDKDGIAERWEGNQELPIVLGIDGGEYFLITAIPTCFKYRKEGRPSPPYLEYRIKDKQWRRVAWSGVGSRLQSNILVFSDPRERIAKYNWMDILSRNMKSPRYYTEVQDIRSRPEC